MGSKKVKISNDVWIPVSDRDLVTVTRMGHITELQYLEKMNSKPTILKLSADQYMVLSTGEIFDIEKTEKRVENTTSLRKTFKKMRYLINNNFEGRKNELFITLTFAPDSSGWRPSVADTDYLGKCFKAFMQRIKRKYGSVDFIRVLEPHEDGKAHYHVLLRFNDCKSVYIANSDFRKLWTEGFVTIHSLKDVDNIGAYVSAYFTDIELNDKTYEDLLNSDKSNKKVVEKGGKQFIKGGRLQYYPTGVQIYNKSKGIIMPEREVMSYKKAKKIAGSDQPTFEKNYLIEADSFSNKMRIESYNSKR